MAAVKWLYKNLKSHFEHDGDLLEVVKMSFEIAQEMEKQQIIDAYIEASTNLEDIIKEEAENYYNETFK